MVRRDGLAKAEVEAGAKAGLAAELAEGAATAPLDPTIGPMGTIHRHEITTDPAVQGQPSQEVGVQPVEGGQAEVWGWVQRKNSRL